MEANRRRSFKRCCKIPRLRLWMRAVQTAVVTRSGSNGYESARTSSSLRNDVSRFGQSRPELRRDFFCWRAHDGNFLPANVHGKKTGARECRFFRDVQPGVARRVSSLLTLSSDESRQAATRVDRAFAN